MSEFLEPFAEPLIAGAAEAIADAVVEGVAEGVAEGIAEGTAEAVSEAAAEQFVIEDEAVASGEYRNLASRLSDGLLRWDPDGLADLYKTDEARALVAQVVESAVEKAKAGTPVRTGAHHDAIYGQVIDGADGKPAGVVASSHPPGTWSSSGASTSRRPGR